MTSKNSWLWKQRSGETHYKSILKGVGEEAGLLKVIKAVPGRKAGTFGDPRMVVRFG